MNPAPLIVLDRVDVDIAGAPVLRGVTWRLERGERWGIVGANGSGKTTFLGLLAGTVWPAPERGERRYDFGRGAEHDAVAARGEIVVVSHELQDRYARLNWNFTALDVVLSGIYRTDVPRRHPEARERKLALATMGELGVALLAPRRFLELSRGEQRRVLIARGVAFAPSVLLLDEPASGLDRAARIDLDALLERVPKQVALVCAAHVEADLPGAIDRILRLERGRIVASATRSTQPVAATSGAPRAARRPAQRSRGRLPDRAAPSTLRRGIAGQRIESGRCRSSRSRMRASGSARAACSETSIGESTRGNNGS